MKTGKASIPKFKSMNLVLSSNFPLYWKGPHRKPLCSQLRLTKAIPAPFLAPANGLDSQRLVSTTALPNNRRKSNLDISIKTGGDKAEWISGMPHNTAHLLQMCWYRLQRRCDTLQYTVFYCTTLMMQPYSLIKSYSVLLLPIKERLWKLENNQIAFIKIDDIRISAVTRMPTMDNNWAGTRK